MTVQRQDSEERLTEGSGGLAESPPREIGRAEEDFERGRTQLALRSSEARFRLLIDSVRDYAIFMVGPNGHVSTWNLGAERILGYPPDEIIGHSIDLLHTEADRELKLASEHLRLAEMFGRFEEEGWRVRKDGERFWAHGTASALWDDTGLIGFAIVMRDLSERREAEESLRQNESRFRSLIENASDSIEIVETDLTIVYASPAVERVLGFAPGEIAGRSLAKFIHPEDLPHLESSIRQVVERPKATMTLELRKQHRSGVWHSMHAIVSNLLGDPGVRGLVITCRDVTEQNMLAAQLRQAQKMEAIGQLAGGVAHDFNNLLTVIKGNVELMRMDCQTLPAPPEIGEIIKAADRAAALTRQLLAFSRKQLQHTRAVNLNEMVEEFEPMLRRLIGEDVQVVSGLAPSLPSVLADPGQLHQVLMNLALNARDSMAGGGVLLLETSVMEVDEHYARAHPGVAIPHGTYVQLTVTDDGSGMSEEVRSRLFEPFFTTKAAGKGTGLGLATVYGIVKQSGGFIWADSEPGKGTAFQILLPAVPDRAVAEYPPAGESGVDYRGSETVLLVEDEAPLRELTQRVLERQGYHVLSARNGREAVETATTFDGPIHLVLTDLVLPGMSGREIGERLGTIRPHARLLYMSGYTDDEIVRRGLLDPSLALLEKPFSPADLARTVRRVLDGADPTTAH